MGSKSRVFVSLLAASGLSVAVWGQTADGVVPGIENVCDELRGETAGLYGLCVAFCEAKDCDSAEPRASARSCERTLHRFQQRSPTGSLPPCLFSCLPAGLDLPEIVEVYRGRTDTVETLELEEYLRGVLPREIGTQPPVEALKAQAVASRSYVVWWIRSGRGPICDTTQCQVYDDFRAEATDAAVDATASVVALSDSEVIWGGFHAESGGHTEDGVGFDYLVAVPDLKTYSCAGPTCDDWHAVEDPPCLRRGGDCCYPRHGHALGMSQRGAIALAACGYRYDQILKHYYTGIELARPCQGVGDSKTRRFGATW